MIMALTHFCFASSMFLSLVAFASGSDGGYALNCSLEKPARTGEATLHTNRHSRPCLLHTRPCLLLQGPLSVRLSNVEFLCDGPRPRPSHGCRTCFYLQYRSALEPFKFVVDMSDLVGGVGPFFSLTLFRPTDVGFLSISNKSLNRFSSELILLKMYEA